MTQVIRVNVREIQLQSAKGAETAKLVYGFAMETVVCAVETPAPSAGERGPFTVYIDASTIRPDVLRALLTGQPLPDGIHGETPTMGDAMFTYALAFAKGCVIGALIWGSLWLAVKASQSVRSALGSTNGVSL